MSVTCRMSFNRFLLFSMTFVLLAGGRGAQAQTLPLHGETIDNSALAGSLAAPPAGSGNSSATGAPSPSGGQPAAGSPGTRATAGAPNATAPAGPEFQLHANVNFSESYVTNSAGVPGASQPDYLSTLGLDAGLHEHTRRITLDANYDLYSGFYAKGTLPTQVTNYLQALGDVKVIPEYLDLDMRAFSQPVVTSNFGTVAESGREVPGGYLNSYGYYATPDLTFNLGDFASSKTMPSFGQVFFTTPAGTTVANTIPGLGAAANTSLRSLTEQISSGPDFDRLNWKLVGLFSETDQDTNLLSEKSGIASTRYALDNQWSLLATAGYDAIKDTLPLTHNISGPVALGGVGLTFGKDFSLQVEAGDRYNSLSIDGNLGYDLSPTSMISASVNDYVQTPEGQLLNNLTNLTALPNGMLTSANNILPNGTPASPLAFNVQSPDNPALNQFVSRYQIVDVSFAEQFGRTNASVSVFGTRRTILTAGYVGTPTADSWGVQLLATRKISPLLTTTLGGSYIYDQEFGGQASLYSAQAELDYSLSRQTRIFFRSDYLGRLSSNSLLALSTLAGNTTDFRATLGISHDL